jgi:hypothetical protein
MDPLGDGIVLYWHYGGGYVNINMVKLHRTKYTYHTHSHAQTSTCKSGDICKTSRSYQCQCHGYDIIL